MEMSISCKNIKKARHLALLKPVSAPKDEKGVVMAIAEQDFPEKEK